MTCPYTVDVAAYVLNALEPAEAGQMGEHLPDCPGCRPAYDELRGLTTLLDRLTPADLNEVAAPTEPPDTLREKLLAGAAARRRRRAGRRPRSRRRTFGLAAVAAAVVAGVTSGIALPGDQLAAPESTTVAATDPATRVHASITLTAQTWGTQLRLRLSGVQSAQRCVLVVTSADGHRDVAATWVATYSGAFNVTGTTAIPERRIHELDVVTTSGTRLVTVPAQAHQPVR